MKYSILHLPTAEYMKQYMFPDNTIGDGELFYELTGPIYGLDALSDPAKFDTVLEALCAVDDFAGLSSAGLTSLADEPCNVCLQEFQIVECEE